MEIKTPVYTLIIKNESALHPVSVNKPDRRLAFLLRDEQFLECPHSNLGCCGGWCPAFQIRESSVSKTRYVELKCFPQEVTYPITEKEF